jgi:serine/threonine-protein kinase HipA
MYDVTCIPLSGYSTQMPFDFGAHRAMDDIDERDIMSIALNADVNLGAFDKAIEEIIRGFETPATEGESEATQRMLARIVENSKPRLAVLKRYLGR